jgi:hypothetical protein
MRITSLLVAFITGLTLAVAGCGGTSELEETPVASEAVVVEEQQPTDNVSALAICPLKWTCYDGKYYSTQAHCTTACGGATCERDYACNGTCVCP